MTKVVIVESPAKAKTINKYLGSDYQVVASYGHVRDLPSKDGSVNPDNDFSMEYQISPNSHKHIKTIVSMVKKADTLYLASDPDREGEAIAWHVVEALKEEKAIKKGVEIHRIVFNEITQKAVKEAIQNPRDIDMNLVNAQQARRALDYLVGFTLSPVLWRKLPGSKSAGRVQSVALRLICDREQEIENFKTQEYWSIKANLSNKKSETLIANLTYLEGEKLEKFSVNNKDQAEKITKTLETKNYQVANIEKKKQSRNPYPPFTTSSLQQEASRKLGFSTSKTMQVAQKLYEGVEINGETIGLITYMRTDGVSVSGEAVNQTRNLIIEQMGKEYLPKEARLYKTKAKNAQEAHEAIRPTNVELTPKKLKDQLTPDYYKLYDLIWKRMVACQMENAILDQVIIDIESTDKYAMFRSSGSVIAFDGFYKLYREGVDDDPEDEESKLLPSVDKGEALDLNSITPSQHFTEPPPRFAEASLVKKLEELGIGRPSTYSAIISVLQDREYVQLIKKRFIPEDRGMLVTAFLKEYFISYVEYDFTAQLENKLDYVSNGELDWKVLLNEFWSKFIENITKVKEIKPSDIMESINNYLEQHFFPAKEDGSDPRLCPSCNNGKLSIRGGKFGAFIACSNYSSSPECKYTREVSKNEIEGEEKPKYESKVLGNDHKTGHNLLLKKGPYGFYLQLGEEKTAKRIAVPKDVDPDTLELEKGLLLISLPREVGNHPETGKVIKAGIGKFGAYLHYNDKYHSLPAEDDVLTVSLERAIYVIENGAKNSQSGMLKSLGNHPTEGKEIAIYNGRYGPYIKFDKLNVPMPKKQNIDQITLEQAIELIEAKKNAPVIKK